MARPCRIYPLGANTELATQENGNLYIGSVTETGSGASANIGKITTITSTPGAVVYDDVFSSGDYLVIRHQEHGMLGVGQWIKVQSMLFIELWQKKLVSPRRNLITEIRILF